MKLFTSLLLLTFLLIKKSDSQADSPTAVTSSTISSMTPVLSSTGQATAKVTSISSTTNVFWVITVVSEELTVDLTNSSVTSDLEIRLSTAYSIGYGRTVTANRRKRSATNGVNTLTLVSVTRPISNKKPTNLVYFVRAPDFVYPATVVTNMNQLTLQEMTLYMNVPVITVATLYNPTQQSTTADNKFWIFGAVFGSLAATAFLIWLVLFIYRRCLIPYDEPLISEKSLMDLESETSRIQEDYQDELIMPTIKKSEKSIFTKPVKKNGETIVNYDTYDFVAHTEKEAVMYNERTPRDIIIKDAYENPHSGDNDEYKIRKNRTHKARHVTTVHSSLRRSHRTKSREYRRRTKKENKDLDITIRQNQQVQLSTAPEFFTEVTDLDDTTDLEDELASHLEHEPKTNKILVESLDDIREEESTEAFSSNNKEPTYADDDEVLYPTTYSDNYHAEHIYPVYRDTIVISDSSLTLNRISESEKLKEIQENRHNELSKKKNMRTLNPISTGDM